MKSDNKNYVKIEIIGRGDKYVRGKGECMFVKISNEIRWRIGVRKDGEVFSIFLVTCVATDPAYSSMMGQSWFVCRREEECKKKPQ